MKMHLPHLRCGPSLRPTISLLLAVLIALLAGCDQESTSDTDPMTPDPTPEPDYVLPEPDEPPEPPPPVIISPPDPCSESQAIDFIELAEANPDGALVYEGQLQDDAGFTGSCGGGGSEASDQAVRFTAPEAGTWQFLLTPRALRGQTFGQYDPVLHARTTCDDAASELACNDDVSSGRLESSLRLPLEAGDTIYLVVDTVFRAINARYELSARRLPIVGVDEACDVASEANGCPEGTYCRTNPDVRGPEGVCAPDVAPTIDSVEAYDLGDDLGLVVTGTDPGADIDRLLLNLLDANGNIIQLNAQGADTYILLPIEPTFGQNPAEFRFRSNFLAAFPATSSVRARLLDARENESEPVDAGLLRPQPVIEGNECDGSRIRNACAAPTACIDADGDDIWLCTEPSAPRITRAKGYYSADTLLSGFQVDGIDPDRDVVGVFLELFDGEGDTVASGDIPLDFVRYGGGNFTGLVSIELNRDRGAASARLTPYDGEGLRGEPFDAGALTPPRVVDEGAVCDPAEAQAICAGDSFCFVPEPGELPVCGAPDTACPAEWGPIVDLNAYPDGDVWRYSGDLTTSFNRTQGSCGGGSAQTILRFAPEEAGRYTFVTYSEAGGADTVLYTRSHCGFDAGQAAVELACNDNISVENDFSLLEVELAAEQEIFVFVDGFVDANGAWRGPYSLTVRRQP